MRYIKGFIIIVLILCDRQLDAQSIRADRTSGCDSLTVKFSLDPPVAANATISWDFGNGKTAAGIASPSVRYDAPGKYSVSCLVNNTTSISAPDFIRINKTPSSAFNFTDSLSLSTYYYIFRHIRLPEDTGTLIYMWRLPDGSTETTSVAEYDFEAPGTYPVSLIVSSSSGCADTTIRRIGVANLLEIPNVFTPNDDAINDFFLIRTDGIRTYIFSVYTRSGVLIYRSESPTIEWNGRSFSGQVLTQGIYFYTIQEKGGDSAADMKGIVYLLR